jgi:hypothetical protein
MGPIVTGMLGSRKDGEAQAEAFLRTARHPTLGRGDIPMLEFTQHPDKPSLRLLLLHDDNEREFDYTSGAEQALEVAGKNGWTIVSMKRLGHGLLTRHAIVWPVGWRVVVIWLRSALRAAT